MDTLAPLADYWTAVRPEARSSAAVLPRVAVQSRAARRTAMGTSQGRRRHWDVTRAVRWWFIDDSAQELAEYAWLAFWVGLSGLLVWAAVVVLLGDRYTDYIGDADPNNITGVQQLWDQPPPP